MRVINPDDCREDFITEVYRVLDTDPNNDRANQIIDAFDNLPEVERLDIDKACDWLTLNIGMLLKVLDVEYNTNETDVKDFIEDFRKAMK